MALSSYSDLQAAISIWLDGTDLSGQETTLIALAEAEINDRLAAAVDGGHIIRPMITRGSLSITASEYLALPDDNMLLPLTIEVTDYNCPWKIEYLGPDDFLQLKVQIGTNYNTSQPPARFTVLDDYFRFWPAPSQSWAGEYIRFDRLPALQLLSDAGQSNWLLTNHPNVYLYGTLAQAELMGWNDSRMANLATLFSSAMDGLVARYPVLTNQAKLRTEVHLLGRNSRIGMTFDSSFGSFDSSDFLVDG